MKIWKRMAVIVLAALFVFSAAACGAQGQDGEAAAEADTAAETASEDTGSAEANGEVMILFTSDVHCGIDEGFGYVGLQQVRDELEAQGYATILIDDGRE